MIGRVNIERMILARVIRILQNTSDAHMRALLDKLIVDVRDEQFVVTSNKPKTQA